MLRFGWQLRFGKAFPKPFQFLILFCLCCFLTGSCSRSNPDVNAAKTNQDRIILGTTASINSLDPAEAYNIFSGTLLYNLGDCLYTYKLGTNDLQPQLATSLPKVSSDGITYTIPLRQGVVFHDSTPFDAKAMAFSLQRFMQLKGAPSSLLSRVVASVKATSDYELTIKLKKPFAAFPALLAFSGACAVSPHAYEIKEKAFKPEEFVGTGPYKLAKFGTDQIRLDAFNQYWGEKPANKGIDIQFFSNSANLYNAFRIGAIDLAYGGLATEQISSLRKESASKHWQLIEKNGSGINFLTLNLNSPPLDKLEIRQAIAAIVDRPLLQDRVFQGQIDPLYSLIPNTLDVQKPIFKDEYGDSNAAKAAQLLEKLGYSQNNPLKLEFWYRSDLTNDQLVAITLKNLIQKRLSGLLQLKLQSVETTTAYNNLSKGAYPIFLLDWAPDFLDADNYIQPFLECGKGSVKQHCEDGESYLWGSFYYSDRANQLIDQSRKEQNPAIRKQVFAEIQNLLGQDVPFIPLWQNKDYLFTQQWIQGASLEVTQKVPFRTLHKS
jgi:peptide/nickel transport system substrate-binding protein